MLTDLTLASLHHLLVFGLVSMLVAQAVLLRGRMDGTVLAKLGGIDRGYGITALSLLVVGFLRVFHGVMGEDFYLHNPWFHAKVGAFVLVGLVSIWPTVRFLRWRKALKADPAFLPAPAEVRSEEHTSELQSLMRISYAVFCLKKKNTKNIM